LKAALRPDRHPAGITAATGNLDVAVARLDLADQGSIAAFAQAWDGPLHLRCAAPGSPPAPAANSSAYLHAQSCAANWRRCLKR
jgi:hypothetical protein